MITVESALELVLQQKKDYGAEKIDLLKATGRVLRETVIADRDFPACNKVTMDGISINTASFLQGKKTYFSEGLQAAGSQQMKLKQSENCIEVMTGAILPLNTDAVVPYEMCSIKNNYATLLTDNISTFQNVHIQGRDAKANDVLLHANEKISPAAVGLLASVGISEVPVSRFPKVAIYSTGDELIDVSLQPEPHQVRRSNSFMIAAALLAKGLDITMDHLPDDVESIKSTLQTLSNYDVIILSGAVSKGKYDLLPEVLQSLGMKVIFHNVAQRPGKPFLFGAFPDGPVVFAFPGNPVSTCVCFYKYFMPWLQASLQFKSKPVFALLGEDVHFEPALSFHVLVSLIHQNGLLTAIPLHTSTSGDLVTLTQAEGFITLPASKNHFYKGELYEVTLFASQV